MRRRTSTACMLLLVIAVTGADGQLVNGRFTTSLYTFQRFDTVGSSKTYLRAFQSVQLSVAQQDFSVHAFLLGAMNGANAFGDNANLRVYNFYARWANIGRMLDVDLGRQAVYAGVGNGTIDGVSARARFMDNAVTVAGYGGSTVRDEYTGVQKNWHDNLNLGGQVVTTLVPGARVGLSYMYRTEERQPYVALRESSLGDSLRTLITAPYLIADRSAAEQRASADAYWSYARILTVYGRYDYDLNYQTTARGVGSVRVNVTDALALTGDYTYRKPDIAFNSIFSVFTQSATTTAEGGVEYGFTPLLRAFARLGVVSYTDTTSTTWSAGLNSGYGTVSYSGSTGYAGRLTSLSAQGMYPLCNGMLIPSAGVSFASYRFSPEEVTDRALALLLGATLRPSRNFSIDVQGQWMTNRLYDRDARLQVRLMYWFAERLSLFGQEVH